MKIGIFLGYGPQVTLVKEGLGRYLAGLIKGFISNGVEVTIACPHWQLESLEDLLKNFSIDENNIKWISPVDDPPVWKLYQLLIKPKKVFRLKECIKAWGKAKIKWLLYEFASTITLQDFIRTFLPYIILGILLLPLALICGVLYYVYKGLAFVIQKVGNLFSSISRKIITDKFDIMKLKDFRNERFQRLQLSMFKQMSNSVNEWLIDKINKQQKCTLWFIPSIFWPQVNDIRYTTVINAPDLVSEEFPIGFAELGNASLAIQECRETIENGRYFVTYCEYLKRSLLENEYLVNSENVAAIPHMNNDMSEYITIDPSLIKSIRSTKDMSREFAKILIHKLHPLCCTPGYPLKTNWDEAQYIFYPSQIRPNKNVLSLIKAYKYLLREKFLPFKLVMTGNPLYLPMISGFITENELQNDIIFFFNIPSQDLAALYKCADLVVNPTLYEGGFPFTFGEGMSVGTPSIMSRIPQTQDVLEPAGLEDVMFDPYDWCDIAKKIEYWLPRCEELYQKELPLYNEMAKRTPEVVAGEYMNAFQKFIDMDRLESVNKKNEQVKGI